MPEDTVLYRLEMALEDLKSNKPNDRSEWDRRMAIEITELEKLIAIHKEWRRNYMPTNDIQEPPQLR